MPPPASRMTISADDFREGRGGMPGLAWPGGTESTLLAANGIVLHTVLAGPAGGPLVILLHGFPEFWYGWRHQLAPLAAAGLRVVAPDQRGYNLSDKPAGIAAYGLDTLADDVLALASVLGHERFAVIGHDWGGVVARHLAGRNPERISRAAILNAPHPATLRCYAAHRPRQLAKSWYVGYFQLPLLPELSLRAGNFWILERVLRQTSPAGAFSADDLRLYRQAWRRKGALSAALDWYRALRHRGAAASPGRIRVKLRVIWGERDAFLEAGLAEAGLALCDDAELFRLPLASHWLQHEAADEVNRLLLAFLC
jgi:pimeloyl-ACP methyl ester carboxylesterase